MSFVKLYGTILSSSIWLEDDATRLVWITMLAMADQDGVVLASVGGLAHHARVERERCIHALGVLSSPDADDRSGVAEGRRIEAIQGGWVLLNHGAYRERAMTGAERVRKSRAKRVTKNVTNHAEADRDADADRLIRELHGSAEEPVLSHPPATPPKPRKSDPYAETAARILAHLNSVRSEGVPGSRLTDAQWIVRLVRARPDAEAEARLVLEDMAAEARRTGDWKWVSSSTPFRLAEFEGRLARAQARAAKAVASPSADWNLDDWVPPGGKTRAEVEAEYGAPEEHPPNA